MLVSLFPNENGVLAALSPPVYDRLRPSLNNSSSVSTHTHAPRFPDRIVSPDATGLLIGGREETDGAPLSLK
jgi:hypothetical protein